MSRLAVAVVVGLLVSLAWLAWLEPVATAMLVVLLAWVVAVG